MSEPASSKSPDPTGPIGRRAERKLRSRRRAHGSILQGLGFYGLVGWSVAVPAVGGTALGLWLDRHWGARISWTLTLLCSGILLGCLNVWYWIKRQSEEES